eukprot:COSAG02_NODE_23339_length_722_cov_0.709470_2_plen_42_part_01
MLRCEHMHSINNVVAYAVESIAMYIVIKRRYIYICMRAAQTI